MTIHLRQNRGCTVWYHTDITITEDLVKEMDEKLHEETVPLKDIHLTVKDVRDIY